MLRDIFYWTTYPLRRLIAWARHRLGICHAWCAHCITEANHCLSIQEQKDKIIWMLGDPEPITWDEYCLRMQKQLDKQL